MKPEQQRIKIAEACGWTQIEEHGIDAGGYNVLALSGIKPPMRGWMAIPDYPNDLNAMHQAEKVLTGKQTSDYWVLLMQNKREIKDSAMFWTATHATSAQRAEAFLRAVGKWEDGE